MPLTTLFASLPYVCLYQWCCSQC